MSGSSPKRFLVTGGAGFIGGNFISKVLTENVGRVLVLDAFTYAGHHATLKQWAADDRFELVEGNICDAKLVRQLIHRFKPHYLVHFAAESHVDRSIDSAYEFIQTNVAGTLTLLDAALEYWRALEGADQKSFRFHHISTDEVFGSLGVTGAFREDTPYAPNSPYAASKAGSDHLVRAYNRTYGLPTTVTNCSNNYGPYQFPEKLLPLVLMNAIEGRPIPVYGDGLNIRDWLYVEDHCNAILHVLAHGKPGSTYNVGGNSELTNLDLLGILFDALTSRKERLASLGLPVQVSDYRSLINFVTDRPGHDRRYAVDAGNIRRELGWQPAETIRTGIARTVDWYLDNLDWCEAVLGVRYDRRRLGLSGK